MPVCEVTGRPLSVREAVTRQSVLGPGNAVQIHVTVLPLSRGMTLDNLLYLPCLGFLFDKRGIIVSNSLWNMA